MQNKTNFRPRLPIKHKEEYTSILDSVKRIGLENAITLLNGGKNIEKTETQTEISATIKDVRILSLDEFAVVHNIDLSKVEVISFGHKAWDMAIKNNEGKIETKKLYSTSGKFKKTNDINFNIVKEDFIKDLLVIKRPISEIKHTYSSISKGNLLEVCLYDVHINKKNYKDTKINFVENVKNTVCRARQTGIEKVLIVVGGDFFNIDNIQKTTFGSTPQDVEFSYEEMIRYARKQFTYLIDWIKEKNNVDIVFVPGNHDKTTLFTFGEMIDIWYRNDKNVTVFNSEDYRKYYQWGKCLLGFTHGDKAVKNLSNLMALEAKEYWATSEYYEWHIGHIHTQKEFPRKEENGVIVRYVSSISAADRWHYENGYDGNNRIIESFIWNKEIGKTNEILK